jgi:non-specific serine/threonine protein kinase
VRTSFISSSVGPSSSTTSTFSAKTRLPFATARLVLDRFPHGVWFVDLAAVRDPQLLESAVASTLGVREAPDRAIDEALHGHLRARTTLLVLDNLEQLLPDGATIVARLVRDAPNLRVLATSRELLRITGERGHPVPPLDLEAGVALFVDRARALRPDLTLGDDEIAPRSGPSAATDGPRSRRARRPDPVLSPADPERSGEA